MIDSFSGEYAFLSNFYPSSIPFIISDTERYNAPTVEHYFQAMKSLSDEECFGILAATTPGDAKRLGRKCTLRKDWEDVKVQVMRDALRKKFINTELSVRLLATGDHFLVEGNHWNDTFWGVCAGKGRNMLGHLLMEIREELKNERK